jgi:hypothetical protein
MACQAVQDHFVSDWRPGRFCAGSGRSTTRRPFLDAVEMRWQELSRTMTAMELGKADLVEVAAEQTHRLAQKGAGN